GTENNLAYISVTDTGKGIDDETMQHLFDPYIRGRNGEQLREGGYGLGLNISKKLVELQNGTVSVESTVGKGSTFTFSLPLASLFPIKEIASTRQQVTTNISLT